MPGYVLTALRRGPTSVLLDLWIFDKEPMPGTNELKAALQEADISYNDTGLVTRMEGGEGIITGPYDASYPDDWSMGDIILASGVLVSYTVNHSIYKVSVWIEDDYH
jgi:hypothetical protein